MFCIWVLWETLLHDKRRVRFASRRSARRMRTPSDRMFCASASAPDARMSGACHDGSVPWQRSDGPRVPFSAESDALSRNRSRVRRLRLGAVQVTIADKQINVASSQILNLRLREQQAWLSSSELKGESSLVPLGHAPVV